MALALQEVPQVVRVNSAIVVSVHRSEGSQWRVVVSKLQTALQGVEAPLKVNLLLDHVHDGPLNVERKAIKAANIPCGAVKSHIPEEVVCAGEQDLEETETRRLEPRRKEEKAS